MRRRAALLLALGLLAAVSGRAGAQGQWTQIAVTPDGPVEPSGVTIRAVAGFQNAVPWDGWFPVRIEVSSSEPVAGRVQVVNARGRILVSRPLALEGGATVRVSSILSSAVMDAPPLTVRLRAEGETLAEVVIEPAPSLAGVILILDPRGPPVGNFTLPGLGPGSAGNPLVEAVAPSELPDLAQAYDGVRAILCGGTAEMAALDDVRRAAILDWVRRGGVLIVPGGASGDLARGALGDAFLPDGDVHDLPAAALAPLARRYRHDPPPAPEGGQAAVYRIEPDPAAGIVAEVRSDDGTPLLLSRHLGRGSVILIALDPWAPPLSTWEGLPDLLADLAFRWTPPVRHAAVLGYALQRGSSGQGRLMTVSLFLLLLAFSLGPFPYWLPGSRYRMWWRVPAALAAFSLLAIPAAVWIRAAPSTVDSGAIAESWVGGSDGPVTQIVLVGSAGRTEHRIEIGGSPVGAADVEPYPEPDGIGCGAFPGSLVGATVIDPLYVAPWGVRRIEVRREPDARPVPIAGSLEMTPDHLRLAVTGLAAFRRACLIVPIERRGVPEAHGFPIEGTFGDLHLDARLQDGRPVAGLDQEMGIDGRLLARVIQFRGSRPMVKDLVEAGEGLLYVQEFEGPSRVSGPGCEVRPELRIRVCHVPIAYRDAEGRPIVPAGAAQAWSVVRVETGADGRLAQVMEGRLSPPTGFRARSAALHLDPQITGVPCEVEIYDPRAGTWTHLGRADSGPYPLDVSLVEASPVVALRVAMPAALDQEPLDPLVAPGIELIGE